MAQIIGLLRLRSIPVQSAVVRERKESQDTNMAAKAIFFIWNYVVERGTILINEGVG